MSFKLGIFRVEYFHFSFLYYVTHKNKEFLSLQVINNFKMHNFLQSGNLCQVLRLKVHVDMWRGLQGSFSLLPGAGCQVTFLVK